MPLTSPVRSRAQALDRVRERIPSRRLRRRRILTRLAYEPTKACRVSLIVHSTLAEALVDASE
jgi:hypothetical protein